MPLLKDQEFGFKYTCGADKGEFKLKNGETKKVERIATGTKCTVEESDAKVPNGFMWTGKIEGTDLDPNDFTIVKDKTLAFTATNTYKQQYGGFTLSKNVTGDATNLEELQKRSYTFNYTCTAPTGTVLKDKVEITEETPKAIGNIPAASTCKVTEVEAPAKDTDWTVDLSVNGTWVGETAEFKVPAEGEPSISILAKNNYRQHKGSFTIEKIVDASEGIVTPKEFTFTWQCGEDKGAETVRVTNGKGRVEIDRAFPVGTKCSVKELEAEAEDARLITSWENQEFTIDKDKQHVIVSATNTYRYAESKVKIVKKLEGPAKDKAKDKTFTFDYSCVVNNEAIEGSVNITGEGATEIPESFPAGTKCTITERDASISGTTWTHRIAEDGQITIQSPAKVYQVGVTNAYSKPGFPWFIPLIPLVIIPFLPLFPHPTPAPQPAPQPTPQKPSEQQPSPKAPEKKPQKEKKVLARTGANVWMFIVIAVLLVLLGAFLRRRGNNS
ncbi:membrane protein [Corynebacterium diphtheriae]|nr:membrane protein [Corynebacterium diphtheriae]